MKHLGITHKRGDDSYEYESRCMLGQLEARMRTTRQKFGSWVRSLEDGTVIVATIIMNGASPIYRVNVVAAEEEATVLSVLDAFMESGFAQIVSRADVCTGLGTWVGLTGYALAASVVPTASNDRKYECITAGVSAEFEPEWSTTPGATIDDGSVTWTCRACLDIDMYYTDELIADLAALGAGATTSWLDWLSTELVSTSRVYTEGMPSLAIDSHSRLDEVFVGNFGARAGKHLLLCQAEAGTRVVSRDAYDGETLPNTTGG